MASSVLLNLCCIQELRQWKEALKTGSNIITDILNKEPEQPTGNIFQNRFNEGKNNLEQKIKK